ncbi:T9SS type A sorting domain-containing protein [Flavobacterium aciduliphilum]|uniref:Putative secreted protein (Por secretion system target) n=1 Tax=Flavobacterium aciduliphilum TaxID=1101402 RepID=A0A328YMN1_9FLAO|nr:T9SS type A sorting domain-containing protein [Flavobacterium aciduliphilum]RAR71827.1 putative secreted protein (Por secretion system target) [Flavobacterium aciduliphilum]
MKLFFTSLSLVFVVHTNLAQDKTFDALKEKTKTHILYDRVYAVSNATKLNPQKLNTNTFLQAYSEIQRSDFDHRLPNVDELKTEANNGFINQIIPLSLLITDFETIKTSDITNGTLFLNSKNEMDVATGKDVLFDSHELCLMGALLPKTKSKKVDFLLKDNLIFNTTYKKIISISYRYETSEKWNLLEIDQPFQIEFTENGLQTIYFKTKLSTGETKEQSIVLNVDFQDRTLKKNTTTSSQSTINPITATIPYQGYDETQGFLGQGEYQIFPDTVDGVLDKPIFLLDGFDPGDSRNIAGIYSLLNYGTSGQNLGDMVRAQGYDLVILNFPTYTRTGTSTVVDGGVDYIQRNAMILVELINQINAQKIGTAKNVVIGPSMGGLISRYALRYMEQHGLNHDTRLYLSFDSPHLGANVPIGFQHLFNYLGFGPVADVTMQSLVNGMLKSPAAREMLIDHFEGHLQSGSVTEFLTTPTTALQPVGCPNFRQVFQNELNTMGFPTTTRNIAIANGAGNGTMTGTPGMVVMNHTFNTSSTQRAIINLNFTPSIAQNSIEVSHFKGQQWVIFWFTAYESIAKSKAPSYTDGLDSAPGGRYDMSSLSSMTTGNSMLTEFMNNLQIMYFDFIPAWSSMSISNTTNLYSPVAGNTATPFVASYLPNTNENHVTLTPDNVTFALNEILIPNLNTNTQIFENNIWVENPIEDVLKLHSNYTLTHATFSITDALGKTIYTSTEQTINYEMELPISLQKGIYILTIQSDQGVFVKKLCKS